MAAGKNTVGIVEKLVQPVIDRYNEELPARLIKKLMQEGTLAEGEVSDDAYLQAHKIRLWDIVFEKEGPDWYLRILIDRTEPLDTDTCAEISHAIDPVIDEADPISQSYYMEVGSPGLGRKLTKNEHYEQLKGQKIYVRLIRPDESGLREYEGILIGRRGDTIELQVEEKIIGFTPSAASIVKLCDDEHLFD